MKSLKRNYELKKVLSTNDTFKNDLKVLLNTIYSQTKQTDLNIDDEFYSHLRVKFELIEVGIKKCIYEDQIYDIDARKYINYIIESLKIEIDENHVFKYKIDVDSVDLDVKTATILGLLFSDFFLNYYLNVYKSSKALLIFRLKEEMENYYIEFYVENNNHWHYDSLLFQKLIQTLNASIYKVKHNFYSKNVLYVPKSSI